MEVTALEGTGRESAEGLARNSPGTAGGKWVRGPWRPPGLSAQNPGDVRGAGGDTGPSGIDRGPGSGSPGVWDVWIRGWGKGLGPKRRGQGPWSGWAGSLAEGGE